MNLNKEHLNWQHCIVCNVYVQPSTRYPNYACPKCRDKAVEYGGRSIRFANETMDGHECQSYYTDTSEPAQTNVCFINGIRFKAQGAYLGGIVLLPFPTANSE